MLSRPPETSGALHPRLLARRLAAAFSLIEVTIAIAVVAFALVALIALLPAGIGISSKSNFNTACGQIFEKVVADARQTDFSRLVYPGSRQGEDPATAATSFRYQNLRYFDDSGEEVIPANPAAPSELEKAKIVYHVNTRILRNAEIPADKTDFVGQYLATLTVQVAHNPGNRDLTFGADHLFVTPPGMQVKTLSVQISKND